MGKRLRLLGRIAKWVSLAFLGLLMLSISGVQVPWFPPTEVSQRQPYAAFVGREYRVTSNVSAYAWNDFPDKEKILSISLISPPGVKNRFVSYVTPVKPGQRVRIVSAWRRVALFGFRRHYVVLLPGAGLPEGVDITMRVNADGVPDPLVYEPTGG